MSALGILVDEDCDTLLWSCNDCGRLVYFADELCAKCLREDDERGRP